MNRQCKLCSGPLADPRPYPAPAEKLKDLPFSSIETCRHCGCGFALPFPEQAELDRYYAAGKMWNNIVTTEAEYHASAQARHRVRSILKHLHGKTRLDVLDVGAGFGQIGLWLGKETGNTAVHYCFDEPDPNMAGFILNMPHSPNTFVHRYDSKAGLKFDVIFLNQVLEHVADPLTFLNFFIAQLNPGGLLFVETPHLDYRFKQDVFPHTMFFGASAYRAIASASGLNILDLKIFGNPLYYRDDYQRRLFPRFLQRIFRFACKLRIYGLADFIDRKIFRYDRAAEDGIWIRAIFSRGAHQSG